MVKVKICGIKDINSAKWAVDCGADGLGFVFTFSPRKVKPQIVKEISCFIPKDVFKVGVFVNEAPPVIKQTVEYCGLNAVQLHGEESLEYCLKLAKIIGEVKIIKAFRMQSEKSIQQLSYYQHRAEAFLLDTYTKNAVGGTGKCFNWDLAVRAKQFGRIILAGGLSCQNVAEAIKKVRPFAVDVSSGVETAGQKDQVKIRDFIRLTKSIKKDQEEGNEEERRR